MGTKGLAGEQRPWTERYGTAIVIAATAAVLRTALTPWLGTGFPYLLFFPAVMLAAWRGGFGPGVTATAIGAVYSDYFFLEPRGSFSLQLSADRISIVLFVGIGTAIAWLHESVQRGHRRGNQPGDSPVRVRSLPAG